MTATHVRVACWPAVQGEPYLRSLYQALESYGIQVAVDGMPFEDSFLKQRSSDFDVIHLNWAEYLWGAGGGSRATRVHGVIGLWRYLRLARRLRIPVLWTVHNLTPHDGGDWIDERGYQALCSYSSLLVVHDESTVRELRRRFRLAGGPPLVMRMGNNRLIWPAPDPAARVRDELGLGPGARLLVCFGHMRPYKGFELPIAAMETLEQNYHLVIAGPPGNPSYAAELQRLASARDRVTVTAARLDNQRLVNLLDAADCVIFPYRQITGSAALLGAFTVGKGVVASGHPYFEETLSFASDAGVLFRSGDPLDLARAVREFFGTPADVRRKAAETIASAHEWPQVVRPLAEWLQRTGGGSFRRPHRADPDGLLPSLSARS